MKQPVTIHEAAFNTALEKSLTELGLTLNEKVMKQLCTLYVFLMETNNKMNLTAITEPGQVAEKHMADSLRLLPFLENVQSLADIGTGAGFPGIPLAIVLPETKIILVESMQKRIQYLQRLSEYLGLKNITILCARAEEIGQNPLYREKLDAATARAVAALPVLCEYLLPLLKPGGSMLAMKGSKGQEELAMAKNAIPLLGGKNAKVLEYMLSGGESRSIIHIEKLKTTPKAYPRRVGIPTTKPL